MGFGKDVLLDAVMIMITLSVNQMRERPCCVFNVSLTRKDAVYLSRPIIPINLRVINKIGRNNHRRMCPHKLILMIQTIVGNYFKKILLIDQYT